MAWCKDKARYRYDVQEVWGGWGSDQVPTCFSFYTHVHSTFCLDNYYHFYLDIALAAAATFILTTVVATKNGL